MGNHDKSHEMTGVIGYHRKKHNIVTKPTSIRTKEQINDRFLSFVRAGGELKH